MFPDSISSEALFLLWYEKLNPQAKEAFNQITEELEELERFRSSMLSQAAQIVANAKAED